jgi:hypothetical protein
MQQEQSLGTNNDNNDKSTNKLGTKESLVTFNDNIQPIIAPTKHTQHEQSLGTTNDNNNNKNKSTDSFKERKEENDANSNDSLDEKLDFPVTSTSSNSSDNDSTYTTTPTSDHWDINIDYRRRSNASICPGDVIEYYCSIYTYSDQQGLSKATVEAVEMPLVLSNSEGLPRTTKVKRIKIVRNNVLLAHLNGLVRLIDWFKLRKRGNVEISDIIAKEGDWLTGIMKKHIKMGMDKCKADGFALEDIIIEKKLIQMEQVNPHSLIMLIPRKGLFYCNMIQLI